MKQLRLNPYCEFCGVRQHDLINSKRSIIKIYSYFPRNSFDFLFYKKRTFCLVDLECKFDTIYNNQNKKTEVWRINDHANKNKKKIESRQGKGARVINVLISR